MDGDIVLKVIFTREKKFSAGGGKYLEIDWFPYTEEQEKAARRPRAKREKATLPKVKNLNDKYSRRMVRLLIEGNFKPGDYHVTLTFRDKVTDEEAQKEFHNYISRLRNAFKKAGQDLMYLYVAEHGQKRGRIHYHIILNSDIPRDDIENLWGKHRGRVNADRLQADDDGTFAALEKYLMKSQAENKNGKRTWNCSRNLKRPMQTTNDNSISKKRVTNLFKAHHNDEFREYVETVYKGYQLVSGGITSNEVTGLLYAEFRLRRRE